MNPLNVLKRRIDILPARHHSRPLVIGGLVLVVMVVALLSAAIRHVPLTPLAGRVMQAEFADADNVTNRTVVRVGGVEVGRVQQVEPGSDPYRDSLVVMRITDPSVHLHSDATAAVRWRTILGGLMYIDLNPGTSARPALQGPIPASQTSHQVEFDQLLEVYRGSGVQEQRNLFHGLHNTFSNPQGVGQTVQTLAPAMQSIAAGLPPVEGQYSGDLAGVVSATAKTLQGLNDTAGLQGLVTGAANAFGVTDAQRHALGQTIDLSPPSLQSTFVTMTRLRTTLDRLDPLVTALKPGAVALAPSANAASPAMTELDATLKQAEPLLHNARPTFDALSAASRSGVPLMNALDPTISRMLSNILPYLRSQDSGTKLAVYEMIGPFWSALDSIASGYDSVGYRIRFSVPLQVSSVILGNPLAGQMQSACAASSLARIPGACTRATQLLTKGWFPSR